MGGGELSIHILRSGDAHPNPGPITINLTNVTALRVDNGIIFELTTDMVPRPETRFTKAAQNSRAFGAPPSHPSPGGYGQQH